MKSKKTPHTATKGTGNNSGATKSSKQTERSGNALHTRLPLLPIPVLAFVLIWLWASYCQGDIFRMARENSFFAFDSLLMNYELCKPQGWLWALGRALLMLFRYPWIGGAVLALMLTMSCWLLGYILRLTPRWRWLQWTPLVAYTGTVTYAGLNNYYEVETGYAMAIPLAVFVLLLALGVGVRLLTRKPAPALVGLPKDETSTQNLLQIAVIAGLVLAVPMLYGSMSRSYVRPIAHMQVSVMEQDWDEVIETAEANAEESYRPFAAQYAIALVQTGQIADRMFNIRLDYDSLYIVGMNGNRHDALNMYLMECDYHAGLVQTAYHHAMENMAMEGPTLRNLKMLCKTALLRGEWEVAEKYLTILDKVPFEGDFVEKYKAMLRNNDKINEDAEFAVVRSTEPLRDNFENRFIQPVFLGYTATLYEGRSINALYNSMMVNIYTKTMQEFLMRSQALEGQTPPTCISQALALMSGKQPEILNHFNGVNYYCGDLQSFLAETQQYIQPRPGITEEEKAELLKIGITPSGSDSLISSENRALHARALFPKYKGYYPYYYFFGNLKATKKKNATESSSAGVN